MFCSKCGKEIDDTATFCNYCGNPVNADASAAPQPAPVQNSAPQYSAPQNAAPQFNAGVNLNLAPKTVDLIDLIIKGLIAVMGLMMIIGCIGSMASLSSIFKNALGSLFGSSSKLENTLKALQGFLVIIRISAIVTFVAGIAGVVFAVLTKKKSTATFVTVGIGTLMFIFHFIMFGLGASVILGGLIAFGIILIILAITLISISVAGALKNGIVKTLLKK